MTALTLQIPEGVLLAVRESADKSGVSVEQFFTSDSAEKLSSRQSLDWLRMEAVKVKRADFEKFLGAVPNVPDPCDE